MIFLKIKVVHTVIRFTGPALPSSEPIVANTVFEDVIVDRNELTSLELFSFFAHPWLNGIFSRRF